MIRKLDGVERVSTEILQATVEEEAGFDDIRRAGRG